MRGWQVQRRVRLRNMFNLPGELCFARGQHQEQRLCVQRWLPRSRRRAVRGCSERAVQCRRVQDRQRVVRVVSCRLLFGAWQHRRHSLSVRRGALVARRGAVRPVRGRLVQVGYWECDV